MSSKKLSLQDLSKEVTKFVKERDWEQFHSPKNLSMDISVEASELMELFLWCESKDSFKAFKDKEQDVKDEIADVLIGVLAFCNITGIDLQEAFLTKLKKAAEKYPIDKCKGKSLKYTEL